MYSTRSLLQSGQLTGVEATHNIGAIAPPKLLWQFPPHPKPP
ncbi:hypothetical protein AB3R30_00720 [Leptolyngbyaceae cyanobacterium UHCC 1019]